MTMQTIEYKGHFVHIRSERNYENVTLTINHPERGYINGAANSLHSAKCHITKINKAFKTLYPEKAA
jgi:hypothetical protein